MSLFADETALLRLGQALRARDYRFVTVTPSSHGRVNARPEAAWARTVEDVLGWSRSFRAGSVPAGLHALMEAAGILEPCSEGWRSKVRVSTLGGDLFFHSAFPTIADHAVFFGPDTYRFAAAIDQHLDADATPLRRAVDIGCGAGPGAVRIAHRHPEAEVLMVDINPEALSLARVNATLAGVQTVVAARSDLLSDVSGQFDLVVANPPYLVDPLKRAYRHGGGDLGAGLSLSIVRTARDRLAAGGTLLLYTGSVIVDGRDAFRDAVAGELDSGPWAWTYREVDPDVFGDELETAAYSHADRIAAVVLTARHQGDPVRAC